MAEFFTVFLVPPGVRAARNGRRETTRFQGRFAVADGNSALLQALRDQSGWHAWGLEAKYNYCRPRADVLLE